MNVCNLTPHDITLVRDEVKVLIPASGKVCRVLTQTYDSHNIVLLNGMTIPVVKTRFGEIEGLPPKQNGKVYIVSQIVRSALTAKGEDRPDVVVPADLVRDDKGNIIGCRKFSV